MKIRYQWVLVMALLLVGFTGVRADQAGTALSTDQLAYLQAAPQLGRQVVASSSDREQSLLAGARDYILTSRVHQKMAEQMVPQIMVPLFIRNLHEMSAWGAKPERMREYLAGLRAAHVAATAGGIKGQVTIKGVAAAIDVTVLAFDDHGYFVADAVAQNGAGDYHIQNLPAGFYYVMTLSENYVDELYNNVPAPLSDKSQWQSATRVEVKEGVDTENINFDLLTGAVVEGRILDSDGVSPVAAETARLVLVNSASGLPMMEQEVALNNGSYRLLAPLLGSFKITAVVSNYTRTWHPNSADITAAASVVIANLSDIIQNVDFVMQPGAPPIPVGAISGNIKGKGQFFGALAGIVFIFDAKDTSFTKLGFGLLGGYLVENLPVGEYFVFGDDYLGNFMEGFGNYVGEFYENAYTINGAKKVVVTADVVTEDIDFVLEPGGTVSGRIKSETGAALDSLMVLAVDPSILEGQDSEPFPGNLKLAACVTDDNGNYKMQGLPAGSYLIRTLSLRTLSIILESPFIKLSTGKHNNKVVDVYYTSVPNLLDYKKATLVPVTAGTETKNINLTLQKARFFTGVVTDNQSGAPMSGVMLFAIESASNLPYPAYGNSDAAGAYRLGPLPDGDYKLLALPDVSGQDAHLSEYYNGARDFSSAQNLTISGVDVGSINFTLDLGATIRGFIDLAGGEAVHNAGADTLEGFPVLVFQADNGNLAGCGFVQFNGGYRVSRLLPGQYKVLALPAAAPFAATYYGGGATFADAASTVIAVDFGTLADANVELAQATGVISGKIKAADSNKPLTHALAIAYDPTGHPVGVGMADADVYRTEATSSDGLYQIKGLRKGNYYVRTFSLSANLSVVEGLIASLGGLLTDGALDNPMALLNGDFFSQLNFKFLLYRDQWHEKLETVEPLDLKELVLNLASSGLAGEYDNALFPVFIPMPYYSQPPKSATAIAVAEAGAVTGIDFNLNPGTLGDWTTVQDEQKAMPAGFQVYANYPNPFNPETTLRFALHRQMQVTVTIYNALGRELLTLADRTYQAGEHQLIWNGRDENGRSVASGLYLAVLRAGAQTQTIKMLLMK